MKRQSDAQATSLDRCATCKMQKATGLCYCKLPLQEHFLFLFKGFSNQQNMNTIVLTSKCDKEEETSHKCIL